MPDNPKTLLELYRKMVTIRQFETKAGKCYSAKDIHGFIHLSIGQEASSVGVCAALRTDDYVSTTHRGHGHIIAKGADLNRMAAELFGRSDGYCHGKGGSMHIADFSLGILGANGVVAGGLPIMVGAGLSIKLRKTDQVAVVIFGDGAANRGTVHEAMNMAAIWKLPVLFVVENNQWSSTTPQSLTCPLEDLYKRAAGYDMPGIKTDGNDVLAVRHATVEALSRARAGEGPSFIENKTYRIKGHFEGDPQKYRTQEDVKVWQGENDPIKRFEQVLLAKKHLTPDLVELIDQEVKDAIDNAFAFARNSPFPKPEDALTDLYINP
jgi:pyruvate dehydrogenase E1 component alpha subunit